MKSILKFCIAAVIMMSLTLTGCGTGKNNKVVAEVNGEKILREEFLSRYNASKAYYGITDESEKDEKNKDMIDNIKKGALEDLIYEKLIGQKVKEAGFSVTDEILNQAKEEFNKILASVEAQMKMQSGADTSSNTDYAEEARKYIDEQLKAMGKTQDEYIKMAAQQIITEKFMEKAVGEIQITDDEVKAYYDSELTAQKEGTSSAEEVNLYGEPQVRVKHILILLPEAEQDEYASLSGSGKTEEARKYLEEKLKGIYPKANDVLGKAKKGENFEKLVEEYGEDPGMKGNSEGYIVKQDGQFVPEFEKAAFSLKEGKISGLVASSYGYHIIKAYEVTEAKISTLEEKKAEIKEVLTAKKQDEKWTSLVDEWRQQAKVTKYEDRL